MTVGVIECAACQLNLRHVREGLVTLAMTWWSGHSHFADVTLEAQRGEVPSPGSQT